MVTAVHQKGLGFSTLHLESKIKRERKEMETNLYQRKQERSKEGRNEVRKVHIRINRATKANKRMT